MISKDDLEARLARLSPDWWDKRRDFINRENYYHCRSCRKGIVTIDRDAGVTPSFKACLTDGCESSMMSQGYPSTESKPAWLGEPTHEWYRPEEIDDDADDELAYYLMDGGLLLRKVESGKDQA